MRPLAFFGKKNKQVFSPSRLSGLIVPLITPLNPDLSVDFVALKALTARLLNKGVRNFFVLSSFSEETMLSPQDRLGVLRAVSLEVKGRGFVLAGCFGADEEEVVFRIKEAQEFADICVINIPVVTFGNPLSFADFFDSLMKLSPKSIMVYNNPYFFGGSLQISSLDYLVNWEPFVGLIDASRDPDHLEAVSKYASLTKLFEENEELAFDALRKGFSGLSCVSSLIVPGYYLRLIEGFDELDFAHLMRHEAKVSAVCKVIPPSKRIQAIKHVLAMERLIQPFYFEQLGFLSEKEKQVIDKVFNLGRKGAGNASEAKKLA